LIKSRSTGRPLVSSTTELTGLVPGVAVLLFEADSESDSDSGQEPGLRGDSDCYYWRNNNKHTLFSQKNKDKSNEVTWGFLNIISGWCSIRFTATFPPLLSLLHFPLLHFHPCNFARIAFSTPAFLVAPILCLRLGWEHHVVLLHCGDTLNDNAISN